MSPTVKASTARLLTIVAAIGEPISSASSSARSMSATPERSPASFLVMPIVVSAWARSSSSPSSSAIASADSASRPASSGSSAMKRMRAETARTRAADGRARALAERLGAIQADTGGLSVSAGPRDLREERLGLRGTIGVPGLKQGVARFLERGFAPLLVVRVVERACSAEQQLGTLAVRRPKLQCLVVLGGGDREAVEGEGALARSSQREARSFRELVVGRHLLRGRARAPSSSDTRASPRGPRADQDRRSTPRPHDAVGHDRHVGSGRRTRRGRARARTRIRSLLRATICAGDGRSPCVRASGEMR